MKLNRLILIAACTLLVGQSPLVAAEISLRSIGLGAGLPVTYNSARAQTTASDFRFGLALAGIANLSVSGKPVSLMFAFSKAQLLSQHIDGTQNSNICSEAYSQAFFSFPGNCTLLQFRLTPLIWFQDFGAGFSMVYNYFSDYSFKGSRVYNTRWSNAALGLVGAYRKTRGKFTLMATIHIDYALISTTLIEPRQSVRALQAGVTLYAIYAIF
jgi:hypothetical protein